MVDGPWRTITETSVIPMWGTKLFNFLFLFNWLLDETGDWSHI